MNVERSQYTHGFCLNCNKIRPVRFSHIRNDEHSPTNVVCNECNFIIAALYKRPVKFEAYPKHAETCRELPRRRDAKLASNLSHPELLARAEDQAHAR